MKGSWSRPINIPIGIGELRLANLLGAMKLGDSTLDVSGLQVLGLVSNSVELGSGCASLILFLVDSL